MFYVEEFQAFSSNMMNLSVRHGNAFKIIYQNVLLCDAVKEVGHVCDDHLHILWTDSPDHNW